ncbi:branched-chain amino acid ABC transporter permease [Seleniivibrio woodruffii]|uniref:Amino acid/amide ABC transporter membrane protein 2 (HAAT family) n=1 Tax=Seleniivibrio woodruffii TaxID=1078050 RepID=A0A4R1K983_9BACT|nr:branched-chain amino acid ABC transporter permease [Seleniivibrio woodruffii]TCK60905.1 amino acid/amide ABC transporter membrane protein 2 (HAAT family) [Seleniivibrio woodruffii]TVZ36535.1 amino acid/amide ABC transporter membrane protein 2, HAAT family (TC 3.A.1.4.-) [Seleniivibrio woodruffii]
MKNKSVIGYAIFFAALALFPLLNDPRWLTVVSTFCIYSVVALSLDIVLGRAGMFDMGHALFFGLGAYITAIMNVHFGLNILFAVPVVIIVPALFAILLSMPIVHLRGDYLLVATIGMNIVFEQALKNDLLGLTGGPNGIFGIEAKIFGFYLDDGVTIYYIAFFLLLATLLIIRNLERSKVGRALHYIQEDPIAAESLGISTRFYRVFSFALGAAIAGLAGFVFSIQYAAVSPEAFNFMTSVIFFAIILVGGKASIPGILAGTFIMFVIPEIFREFATARYFVFGLAMVVSMVLRPEGMFPAKYGRLPKYVTED